MANTQKQMLAYVREIARGLGQTVTIRKNSYEEYETRVRAIGDRASTQCYFTDDWADAINTAQAILQKIEEAQQADKRRRKDTHYAELDVAFGVINTMLSLVGCTIEMSRFTDGRVTVTMRSPKTGEHTLDMTYGTRRVTDLYAHACGFAEQQTHSHVGCLRAGEGTKDGAYADRE